VRAVRVRRRDRHADRAGRDPVSWNWARTGRLTALARPGGGRDTGRGHGPRGPGGVSCRRCGAVQGGAPRPSPRSAAARPHRGGPRWTGPRSYAGTGARDGTRLPTVRLQAGPVLAGPGGPGPATWPRPGQARLDHPLLAAAIPVGDTRPVDVSPAGWPRTPSPGWPTTPSSAPSSCPGRRPGRARPGPPDAQRPAPPWSRKLIPGSSAAPAPAVRAVQLPGHPSPKPIRAARRALAIYTRPKPGRQRASAPSGDPVHARGLLAPDDRAAGPAVPRAMATRGARRPGPGRRGLYQRLAESGLRVRAGVPRGCGQPGGDGAGKLRRGDPAGRARRYPRVRHPPGPGWTPRLHGGPASTTTRTPRSSCRSPGPASACGSRGASRVRVRITPAGESAARIDITDTHGEPVASIRGIRVPPGRPRATHRPGAASRRVAVHRRLASGYARRPGGPGQRSSGPHPGRLPASGTRISARLEAALAGGAVRPRGGSSSRSRAPAGTADQAGAGARPPSGEGASG